MLANDKLENMPRNVEVKRDSNFFVLKKSTSQAVDSQIIAWLGIVNMFQTFEDLESVKDKQADIKAVRQLLDEDKTNGAKEPRQ